MQFYCAIITWNFIWNIELNNGFYCDLCNKSAYLNMVLNLKILKNSLLLVQLRKLGSWSIHFTNHTLYLFKAGIAISWQYYYNLSFYWAIINWNFIRNIDLNNGVYYDLLNRSACMNMLLKFKILEISLFLVQLTKLISIHASRY